METSNAERVMQVQVPPGYWTRDDVYQTEPVMPMWRSVCLAPLSAGMEWAFAGVGTREYRDIGGWTYIRQTVRGPGDPRFLLRLVSLIKYVRNHGELRYARLWEEKWKPRQRAQIGDLERIDLSALSDPALSDHVSSVLMPFVEESLRYQSALELIFVYSMGGLASVCQESLQYSDGQITELVSGLSEATTGQTRRLSALAEIASCNPTTASLLEHIGEDTRENLAIADPAFASAFDAYLRDYGFRVLHHSIHSPTLGERPQVLLRLVRDQLAHLYDHETVGRSLAEGRAAALAKARAALAQRSEKERERFEKALASAEVIYPLKEGGEYETLDAPMALMRYGLLELGARMVRRGHLVDRDDVFFLELSDALEAFQHKADVRDLVVQGKGERAWAETHKGPPSYGRQPAPPLKGGGPPALVRFARGNQWVESQYYGDLSRPAATTSREIRGMAASPGTYTGPARIILSESEFEKLQSGDVLVCRITCPSWAMLFPSIGAIVTDVGGVLSHPAIIAREYRVPAVVATKNATALLKDGQVVTVDGTAGTVAVI